MPNADDNAGDCYDQSFYAFLKGLEGIGVVKQLDLKRRYIEREPYELTYYRWADNTPGKHTRIKSCHEFVAFRFIG